MSKFEVRTDPIQINAPIDFVWGILTEVEKYGEWNPFTPQAQTDFKIGSPAHLRVRMGPTKMKITETVCAFEKPQLIAWTKTFGARWFLVAVRQQILEPVDDTRCTYHNTDQLTGLMAPVVLLLNGGYMRRGFNDVAKGLKCYAEAMYKQKGTEEIPHS